jgi:hypothetical protein
MLPPEHKAIKMSPSNAVLLQAERHVQEGEARVARQGALVNLLVEHERDPRTARATLAVLRRTLLLMREHLQLERDRAP